jgi:hypothetical protein
MGLGNFFGGGVMAKKYLGGWGAGAYMCWRMAVWSDAFSKFEEGVSWARETAKTVESIVDGYDSTKELLWDNIDVIFFSVAGCVCGYYALAWVWERSGRDSGTAVSDPSTPASSPRDQGSAASETIGSPRGSNDVMTARMLETLERLDKRISDTRGEISPSSAASAGSAGSGRPAGLSPEWSPRAPANNPADLALTADRMWQRMLNHERLMEEDAGGSPSRSRQANQGSPVREEAALGATGSKEVDEMINRIQESNADMKVQACRKLRAYKPDVRWSLGGAKERALPACVEENCCDGGSFTVNTEKRVEQLGMRGHHLGEEWLLHAMILDRGIRDPLEEWINLKSSEITARRWYAIKKSLRRCSCRSDWQAPKNPPKSWKSKAEWFWIDEIDVRNLEKQDHGIPSVDMEAEDRMRSRGARNRGIEGAMGGSAGDAAQSIGADGAPDGG